MTEKPFIICLTPVKNEAWILDRFIQCASLWADHIIIADQMSDDGSREIVLKYPKVELIDNHSTTFNESGRQQLLLDAARKIETAGRRRLMISIDADECLSANFFYSKEWNDILSAPIGTVIRSNVINLHPDKKHGWLSGSNNPIGFIDDGKSNIKTEISIHVDNVPVPDKAPTINCKELVILHYQYLDWARMQAKHRWYQCFERIIYTQRHPIDIFRIYHHMYSINKNRFIMLAPYLFENYERNGIDMLSIKFDTIFWWDKNVNEYFEKYGRRYFALLSIWQFPPPPQVGFKYRALNNSAEKYPIKILMNDPHDPRKGYEKLLHYYLFKTQPLRTKPFFLRIPIRLIDNLLKKIILIKN